jgi:hypothetical protein
MPQTLDYSKMEWEERPFGRRTADGYLQIYPGMDTSIGVDPAELDVFRLRRHPNQVWEHVEHLGYLENPQDGNCSLVYKFRIKNGDIVQKQYFAKGARFYSVQTDDLGTGFWHVLENISNRTIVLRITKLNRENKLIV